MTSLASSTSLPTIPCPWLPPLGLHRCPSQASTWGPPCWQFPEPGYKPSHPPHHHMALPWTPVQLSPTHWGLYWPYCENCTLLTPWYSLSRRLVGWFVFTQNISSSDIWCIIWSSLLLSIPDYNIKSMRKTISVLIKAGWSEPGTHTIYHKAGSQ